MSPTDAFERGPFPVGVRTIEACDSARDRWFPCEIWYPASAQHKGQDLTPETQDEFLAPHRETPRRQMAVREAAAKPGTYPLIVFSHHSGGHRRVATFLCTHLSSHGYVVAALDHSEVVAPELARRNVETAEQKAARTEAWIESRVPDIRFLLDYLLDRATWDSQISLDASQIGLVGHSFGGWAALAATEEDERIRSVVALAPGGSSQRKPGMLPLHLTFNWGRDVPALYLVAEEDASLPLAGMCELFGRTPPAKQMVILRRADHLHFIDNIAHEHETVRNMQWPAELAWIPEAMRPMSQLCPEQQAHTFVQGLTVCHMDAVLKHNADARRFLAGDVAAELAQRGVDVIAPTRAM